MQKTYYAVTDAMPDTEGEIIIVTTPVSMFDNKKCLSDRHDPELSTAFENAGLFGGELMDSHFEVSHLSSDPTASTPTVEQVKAKLEAHPDFVESEVFTQFALNFEE